MEVLNLDDFIFWLGYKIKKSLFDVKSYFIIVPTILIVRFMFFGERLEFFESVLILGLYGIMVLSYVYSIGSWRHDIRELRMKKALKDAKEMVKKDEWIDVL